jgi:hypothetical protein
MKITFNKIILFLVGVPVLITMYSNCSGVVQQPKLDDMTLASVLFQHSGIETSCNQCHEKQRPAPVNGAAHGNGADCFGCHSTVSWKGQITISHNPVPPTCIDCHSNARPTVPVGSNNFDHNKYGQSDCVDCHTNNAGISWLGGYYAHIPYPTTCSNCHLSKRPVGIVGNPAFDHANGGTGDCVSCHTNPGSTWAGANYSHQPTPTQCSSCHANERPIGLVGTPPFNHANGGMGDCVSCHKNPGVSWTGGSFSHTPAPTQCLSCHAGKRPVGLIGNPPFNHANGGMGDCVSCHKNPGNSWAGGTYNHLPVPTQCLSCHVSDRPTGLVGNPAFNHANGGLGDCVSCHKKPGVSWTGGLMSHSPVPASCATCHSGQRPAIGRLPNNGGTLVTHYTPKDCFACHLPQSTTVVDFKFSHSDAKNVQIKFCLPCHLREGQAKHGRDTKVILTGDGNCFNCHTRKKSFSN